MVRCGATLGPRTQIKAEWLNVFVSKVPNHTVEPKMLQISSLELLFAMVWEADQNQIWGIWPDMQQELF